jgi:hypothetical protein
MTNVWTRRSTWAVPLAAATAIVGVPRPVAADGPAIEHAAVSCVVAEKHPRMTARIEPLSRVARASLHFRSGAGGGWYVVAMKAKEGAFEGVLPQPKKSLKAFAYYIEAADTAFATSRTPEYAAQVVDGPAACEGKMMAGALGSASVVLEAPPGAPALPVGFAPTGVAATSAGGAVAAGTAAAGGGGATTLLLVGGGVAAAGAAVAVAASHGGGGDSGSGTSGSGSSGGGTGGSAPGGGTRTSFDVAFLPSPPGIDVSPCAGRMVTWCCQVLDADASGNFDFTWAPSEPNTLRVTGRVTDTAVTATLSCTNGAASGSLTATGSGGTYQGSFSLGTSHGNVTVSRKQ